MPSLGGSHGSVSQGNSHGSVSQGRGTRRPGGGVLGRAPPFLLPEPPTRHPRETGRDLGPKSQRNIMNHKQQRQRPHLLRVDCKDLGVISWNPHHTVFALVLQTGRPRPRGLG